jgi:hypothetical protein
MVKCPENETSEIIFPDWLFMLNIPDYLWLEGNKFSPV